MRCKACNHVMNEDDLVYDPEICYTCSTHVSESIDELGIHIDKDMNVD